MTKDEIIKQALHEHYQRVGQKGGRVKSKKKAEANRKHGFQKKEKPVQE